MQVKQHTRRDPLEHGRSEPEQHSSSVTRGLKALADKTAGGRQAGKQDLLDYLKTNFDGKTFTREEFEALDKMVKSNPEKFDASFKAGWEAVRKTMATAGPEGLKGDSAIQGLQSAVDSALQSTEPRDGFNRVASAPASLGCLPGIDPADFNTPEHRALARAAMEQLQRINQVHP